MLNLEWEIVFLGQLALCFTIVLEFEPVYWAGKTCIYNLGQLHKLTNTLLLGIFLLSDSRRYFWLISEPSVSHAYAGFLLLFSCQRLKVLEMISTNTLLHPGTITRTSGKDNVCKMFFVLPHFPCHPVMSHWPWDILAALLC